MTSRKFSTFSTINAMALAVLGITALSSRAAIISTGDVSPSYIGNTGNGRLEINAGSTFSPTGNVILGNTTTGKGTLIISGPGSSWDGATYELDLNYNDSWLHVLNGATMNVKKLALACDNIADKSDARFSGAGTKLITSGPGFLDGVFVGSSGYPNPPEGKAMLTLSDGATMETSKLSVGAEGHVGIKVTGNNMVVVGTVQTFANGVINLMVDDKLANGTYTPIKTTATPLSDSALNIYGATWNTSTHQLTVTTPHALISGVTYHTSAQTGDWHWGDRAIVTDPVSGKQLIVSSQWGNGPAIIQPTFTIMTASQLASGPWLIDDDHGPLAGWWFSDYVAAKTMFTLDIGTGQDIESLVFWQHDTNKNAWVEFVPEVYTYDADGTLSFISSTLDKTGNPYPYYDGFVIGGKPMGSPGPAVPEPASLTLLGLGAAAMIVRRRK
ncbi:MAG: PEP-CTERM sorting domain-containing protein [Phycisphaerales bacterium]|nr:PEP-CTERM sorting domain-containing protein [Phycisphaerales bacterium]